MSIASKVGLIRSTIFGKDVRESIASGIEEIDAKVVSNSVLHTARENMLDSKHLELEIKENNLESTFNSLIIDAGDSNAEIVTGRTSTVTEKTSDTIGHRLDGIDTSIRDIIRYNVKEHPLYDINHVDVAINDIVSKLTEGDTMLLPYGNYNFTSTLNLENIKPGCKIILDGVLKQVGSFTPAIYLSGGEFEFKLNKLYSNITPLADYSNIINDGLVLGRTSLHHATVDVNIIEGFLSGIKTYPCNGTGFQYNKINFNYIGKCKICLLITSGNVGANWVNENTFYGGRLTGFDGVKFIKGTQQWDRFNGNKFYNVGFEELIGVPLYLSYAMSNSFVNYRMAENIIAPFIEDDSTCSMNTFIFSGMVRLRDINVNGLGTIFNGPIADFGGGFESSGFTILSSGVKIYNSRFNNMQYHSCLNVDYTIPTDTGTLGITTDTSPVVITTPKDFEYYSKEFLINVSWYVNSITFKNSDGSESIPAGVIKKRGWYKLVRAGTIWRVFALDNVGSTGATNIQESVTFYPASLLAGTSTKSGEITVVGAEIGDFVQVSAPYSLQGCSATGYVQTTNIVIIVVSNLTNGTVSLSSGKWIVKVSKSI